MCYVNVWDCVCYVCVYELNWGWLCCHGYIVVMFMYACNWDWNRIVIEVEDVVVVIGCVKMIMGL